ncbi:MAG: ABC transporter ATP-binding protein [Actinomycetota bacterium]|nr:ABC transporter ATP-binding protein [Actinomycetota bacterium]
MSADTKNVDTKTAPPGRPPGGRGFGPGGHMGMGAPAAKPRNFKASLKRLASYLKPEAVILIIVLVLGIASVAFSIVGPKLLGNATQLVFEGAIGKQFPEGVTKDQAVAGLKAAGKTEVADMLAKMDITPGAGVDFSEVRRILTIVAIVYALSALLAWLQQYLMAGVAMRSVYQLRRQVDLKLARLPLRYYDSQPRGDVLSRVTNDIDNIAQTLQQSLTQIITAVLTIVGVLGMMIWISPLLALISLVTIPLSIVATVMIAKRSQKQFAAQWASTGTLNGHVEEMFTGHGIVKVFGRQEEAIEIFDEENEKLYQASFKAQFISGIIMPSMNFINNLNYVAIAIVGGLGITRGTISLGDVQAFIQYSRQFTQPIAQTASIANVLQSTIASAERVFELLDEAEETPESETPVRLDHVSGHITLDDVSFRYEPETPLIEELSLDAKPGSTVAIVGPTGAGKTTLVNLLMRFYEIDEGRISIDGVDIRDVAREDLRRTFGMVLQDTWLFQGTIRENIAYGREDATEDQICTAAQAAYVEHFVHTLPDGYDTVLDDEASNISQGERQLLTIARAFLADPEVLILDEATSSVDTRTEVLIQDAMAKLMKGRTSFVIAHRLSTIRNADTIIVMNEGHIIEQGSHDELMAAEGFYCDLYNSQFVEAYDEAS